MCLPEYIYGLILIDSLRDAAVHDAAGLIGNASRRKPRVIYRPRPKLFPTALTDADNVVPAGA
jgi:hypothetical protein